MNYIVDRIGEVVSAMRVAPQSAPFYIFGRKVEIASRLAAMDRLVDKKDRKYPVIVLVLDTEEPIVNSLENWDLTLAIATLSNKSWYTDQRYEETIKPVLVPLYERFLQELKQSGLFVWSGNQKYPPHTRVVRPYWGTSLETKNEKLVLDDPVDAIEILNLKINSTNKPNCL